MALEYQLFFMRITKFMYKAFALQKNYKLDKIIYGYYLSISTKNSKLSAFFGWIAVERKDNFK